MGVKAQGLRIWASAIDPSEPKFLNFKSSQYFVGNEWSESSCQRTIVVGADVQAASLAGCDSLMNAKYCSS